MIDESEAALYDRQIRLWGVEAQNRMRQASVLLVTLRGLATEVAKNLVLAGIGSLTLLDESEVSAEDLGSNYFFRESDVGLNRAQVARSRIQELNPRVNVLAATSESVLQDLSTYDLVCVTDRSIEFASRLNDNCRRAGKKMYAGASLGLGGYIFADLLDHHFIVERPFKGATGDSADGKVPVQRHQVFVPLSQVLLTGKWTATEKPLRPKVVRRMLPLVEVYAFLQLQAKAKDPSNVELLVSEVEASLGRAQSSTDMVSSLLAETWQHDFAPTCAVLGGVLAQDVLNALGGREAPLVNFFVLDAATNAGDIYALGGIERQS